MRQDSRGKEELKYQVLISTKPENNGSQMTGTNENILIFVSILEHEFEKEWTANGGLPYTKNADRKRNGKIK